MKSIREIIRNATSGFFSKYFYGIVNKNLPPVEGGMLLEYPFERCIEMYLIQKIDQNHVKNVKIAQKIPKT